MGLCEREEHLLCDKRLAGRYLKTGELSTKDIAKNAKDLPDLAAEKNDLPAYDEQLASGMRISAGDAEPTFEAAE